MRIKENINISDILLDSMPINNETLRFVLLIIYGIEFPAIKVSKLYTGQYLIRDGRHRVTAYKLLGIKKIMASFSEKCLKNKKITIMGKVTKFNCADKSTERCDICGKLLKKNAAIKGHSKCNKCYITIKAIESGNPSDYQVREASKHVERYPHVINALFGNLD